MNPIAYVAVVQVLLGEWPVPGWEDRTCAERLLPYRRLPDVIPLRRHLRHRLVGHTTDTE